MWCSELSMSSFRAAVICQFPLLFAKFPLEVPFLDIGSKWHQLPSAKLHSSSSPLMTEKWNGTFNYCPCAMGWNSFWNSQKFIKKSVKILDTYFFCFVFQSLRFCKTALVFFTFNDWKVEWNFQLLSMCTGLKSFLKDPSYF